MKKEEQMQMLKFLGKGAAFCFGLLLFFEAYEGNWTKDSRFNDLVLKRSWNQFSTVSYCSGCPDHRVHFQTDAYGFRGKKNRFDNVDILSIGSSTTVQYDINEEDTWQKHIERTFLEKHGAKLNILNAGLDAQTTVGYIRNFTTWFPLVPELKARYALVYVGVEEVFRLDKEKDYSSTMDGLKAEHVSLPHYIAMNSATYFLAHGLWGTWMDRLHFGGGRIKIDFTAVHWTPDALQKNHEELFHDSLVSFKGRLKTLAGKIREMGAEPIFVSSREGAYEFMDGQWKGTDESYVVGGRSYNGMDKFYLSRLTAAATAEVCKEEKAHCVSLVEEKDFAVSDFTDYRHSTPEGVKKIGMHIAEGLEPVLLPRRTISSRQK